MELATRGCMLCVAELLLPYLCLRFALILKSPEPGVCVV